MEFQYKLVTDNATGWFKTIEEVAGFLKYTSFTSYSKCWRNLVPQKEEYTQDDVDKFLADFREVWNLENPGCLIVKGCW